ncbi:MAG: BatD family protein [Armatimonadetes bacterium]|nr:BatD family protein [Armatimonadota bacterium]
MKGVERQSILLLFLLLTSCPLMAQEIRARAEAYPRSCLIGDLIRYRVTVFAPETANVKFPTSSRFGAFEVLQRYPSQKQPSELPGITAFSAEWDIAVYQLGKVTIPPLPITCEMEGRQTLVRTNPVDIEVIPLAPPDAKEPRPAKAPMPYPLSPLSVMLLLFGMLFTLATIWLFGKALLWAVQTAWSSWQKATEKPPLPPHLLALQTIDRAEQLYRQGEIERSFVLLSFGLRRYLRDRFQVPALELPTWNLVLLLRNHLTREQQISLQRTLTLSDLIKFARYNPKEQEAMKLFADARQLVQATQVAETQQEKLPA